jgi:hypothetical protein
VRVNECDVVRDEVMFEVLPYPRVRPYSTDEVAASLVVQAMTAEVVLIEEAVMLKREGAVVSEGVTGGSVPPEKVAVTDLFDDTFTVQVGSVPLHAPDQPVNVPPSVP